jgi:hypothetical protein
MSPALENRFSACHKPHTISTDSLRGMPPASSTREPFQNIFAPIGFYAAVVIALAIDGQMNILIYHIFYGLQVSNSNYGLFLETSIFRTADL